MEHKTKDHPVLYECDEGWHLVIEEDRPILDYINFRINRAHETIKDVEILVQIGSWNSATDYIMLVFMLFQRY